MATARVLAGAAALALFAYACSSSDGASSMVDAAATSVPRGLCAPNTSLGGFTVTEADGSSTFSGSVGDRPNALAAADEVAVADAGACKILVPLKCTAVCGRQACGPNNTCVPYPANQPVGRVTVTGLRKAIGLDPSATGSRYSDGNLPTPAYDPGAAITLSAPGGALGAFTLNGRGVDLFGADTPLMWTLARDTDLVVRWKPGTVPEARVVVGLSVDQHGATPGRVQCEASDADGMVTIKAAVIAKLIELGTSGAASGQIYRRTVDSVAVAGGCVEFAVQSQRTAEIAISAP